MAIILKNQYHTASQTEMRVLTVLVVRTSGSLSEVLYRVMGGPPLKATVAGDLKATVTGDRVLLFASPMPIPDRRRARRRGTAPTRHAAARFSRFETATSVTRLLSG
jgi:hypothetical protein